MNKAIAHLRKRLLQFKGYGYDMLKERDFALAKAGFKKDKRILEIGTGRGYMSLRLAQKGFKLTSIDYDRKIQQSARGILKHFRLQKRVRFRLMSAERLSFEDGSFDYVIAVNFLHHAAKPEKCLKEMARVARDRIVIVDVNKEGARILEKIHAQEGHCHRRSRIRLVTIKQALRDAKTKVAIYVSKCQFVIVARKG